MKVLIIGSGGREHALAWKVAQSPRVERVFVAPGNAGTAREARVENVAIEVMDFAGLERFARTKAVGLTIVGPEAPLVGGIVDHFRAAGLRCFGPSRGAAQLEGSKAFTKDFLARHGIPTAEYRTFTEIAAAQAYIRARGAPIVVKADGLAAGKGVVVAQSLAEAEAAVRDMLGGKFGASGQQILIEDCLVGEETSLLVVVSGRDYVILPTSQDHKRIGDGDTGPNTGGMGTYSPAEVVTPALLAQIEREIVRPSVEAIAAEGIDFRGTLFIGIMLTPSGPSVLEYNTRFGDPETQVVLPRLATDLLALLWAATRGELRDFPLAVRPDYAVCVVIAARGYPDKFPKNDVITLPAALPPQTSILHAGTATNPAGQIVTNGGRVLGVTALGPTLREAATRAYAGCDAVQCATKYFRRDIGARQLNRS